MSYNHKLTLSQICELSRQGNRNINFAPNRIYTHNIELEGVKLDFCEFKVIHLEVPSCVEILESSYKNLNKNINFFKLQFKLKEKLIKNKHFKIIATIDNDIEIDDYYAKYTIKNQ